MEGVEGSFKFKNGQKIKGKFKLSADRKSRRDDKKWKPIKWKGTINDKEVEIIQMCSDPSTIEDFTWKTFPKKYEVVKAFIADAIEDVANPPKKSKK
jgi:hypothetical protein